MVTSTVVYAVCAAATVAARADTTAIEVYILIQGSDLAELEEGNG